MVGLALLPFLDFHPLNFSLQRWTLLLSRLISALGVHTDLLFGCFMFLGVWRFFFYPLIVQYYSNPETALEESTSSGSKSVVFAPKRICSSLLFTASSNFSDFGATSLSRPRPLEALATRDGVQARSLEMPFLHANGEGNSQSVWWLPSLLGSLQRCFVCPPTPPSCSRSWLCEWLDIGTMAGRGLWMGEQETQVTQKAYAKPTTTSESISVSSSTAAASSRRTERQGKRQRALCTLAAIYAVALATDASIECGPAGIRTSQFTECDCHAIYAALSQTKGRQGRDGVDVLKKDVQRPQGETQSSRGHQGSS